MRHLGAKDSGGADHKAFENQCASEGAGEAEKVIDLRVGGRFRSTGEQRVALKHECPHVTLREGRHLWCACRLLTQKSTVFFLICRCNYCCMLSLQFRSARVRDQILEEFDALVDRQLLLQPYMRATNEKHSFWNINVLTEQDSPCVTRTLSRECSV